MPAGITAVLARVQHLQQQLTTVGVATATRTTGTTGTTGTGKAFAAQLASAQGATATGDATAAGPTGQDVVAAARKYLGIPYKFGSTDPDRGLDCSALVQRAYKDLGIDLPRVSRDQAKAGTAVASLAQAKPGDLLAFNNPVSHIAIYIGDNKMIAAPRTGDVVKVQEVYKKPVAIRRVIGAAPAATAAAVVRPASLSAAGLSNVPYGDLFTQAGAKYGVSPKLLAAVAKVESGYNPKAVSPAGARGLMQLMPGTADELGVSDPFNPKQAVNGAAKLLARNLKEFKSMDLALAAYNAGGGAVKKYGGIPPYAETQAYVPKVRKALAALG